jgi:hypothetical protein
MGANQNSSREFGLYPKINPNPQRAKSSGAETGEATLAVPWRDFQTQKKTRVKMPGQDTTPCAKNRRRL